ncbi:tRNA-splicing endonuclease positive effector protein, putative [Eimeria acervulina]|uniref:tRNA-splicing endonuclease positive effector protein, putative n=1 Tax=Eimeria acervulina TaxID=5801 RepID=U6GDV8_EIMAC|nr:tRNA-splicing endonuclease positive effector protein, putative [Eimeria acervulina]CDI76759.1 tRNA-splicing endonuclease positive effector protein, putative [Eimeria acervulina]
MVSLSSEGGGHAGASTFTSQSSSKSRDVCTQEELQRAERLGSAWLQRYRHIEGSSLLPSVDPLNELLLGLDFFADLREEVHTPTGKSSPASVASEDLNEGSETSENENEDDASEEEREEAKGTSQDAQFSEKNSQGHQQREYLRPIPTVIPNENVYIGFFLPLFLQEAKQALARAIKLDLGAPEEFVQQSGEPRGSFLSLLLSRSGGMAAAVSSSACRYCHGDLVLMYLPANRVADDEAEKQTAPHKASEGETQEDSGNKDDDPSAMKASSGELPAVQADALPLTRMLRPKDTDCHVLGVVSQGQHEAISVKVLTPLGPAYNGEGSSQLQLNKAKLPRPLNNPLLEGQESVQSESGEEAAAVSPPVGTGASGEGSLPSEGQRAQTPLASTADEASQKASERQTEEKPQQGERRLVIPEALRARLESLYNASQLAALEDSLKVEGVTLIQGPPGTGKTSTIVGVVSVILHAQLEGQHESYARSPSEQGATEGTADSPWAREQGAATSQSKWRPWLQPNYAAWMDADEVALEDLDSQSMLQPAAVPTDPPICLSRERHELQPVRTCTHFYIGACGVYVVYSRILVCAPSNAAIDEIVKRLTADPETGGGIFDGSGQRFSPAVVRVGPNVHPELLQHSLQYKALQRLRARGSTNFAALAAAKADVLRDSVIVCATISVCGSNDLTSLADCFDTVVVDEASQAVELATLIPLRLGCRRLILVGDPKQLPATIFSRHAIQLRYDRSLFQRLEGAGQPTNMLSQQYRMHPAISRFASVAFYEGLLRDAPHLPNGLWTPFPSWHRLPILQPIVFFNLDSEHTEEHTSLVNYAEADFVRQLIDFLRRLGQEKDFIIFSAVRGIRSDKEEAKNGTVGFLGDMRRLNVAVTRGRVNLWLVGNGCFLRRDKTWARLYAYAKARQALISISRRNAQHSAILTKWILKYCKTHHRERKLLEEHAPRFLADLSENLKAMRERKQKRGSKDDEEQGDELQTEGPISWEQPIDDPGAEEEAAGTGEMTTFHDVADEGCLDEVAVHMRDEALKSAVEAEGTTAPL